METMIIRLERKVNEHTTMSNIAHNDGDLNLSQHHAILASKFNQMINEYYDDLKAFPVYGRVLN
jgi:hypothetical protein